MEREEFWRGRYFVVANLDLFDDLSRSKEGGWKGIQFVAGMDDLGKVLYQEDGREVAFLPW